MNVGFTREMKQLKENDEVNQSSDLKVIRTNIHINEQM